MPESSAPASSSKRWVEADVPLEASRALARSAGIPPAIARSLWLRGCRDRDAAATFLQPLLSSLADPFELPGMTRAVDLLADAVKDRRRITIFGDYDVDGISSTALLTRVLKQCGVPVTPFLPRRVEEGYGLSLEALQRCVEETRPELVVTVDCGTNASASVQWAATRGIEVIVTDHHLASGDPAPAFAVVNPRLADSAAPWAWLSGAGVAFKLAHALLKRGRAHGLEGANFDLRGLLELVALGTVADIVPLCGENRVLARHGLARIGSSSLPGIRALVHVAGIRGEIGAYHVGFQLGPRLNAAGRLGVAEEALELLLTDREDRANILAARLNEANRERQVIEQEVAESAVAMLDDSFDPDRDFGLVAASPGWHPGVIGIVASRICSRFRRPAIVIGIDEEGRGRGSCRSIDGFNMVEGLAACEELLEKFGGHAMAAGLEIKAARIDAFNARFNEVCAARLHGRDLRPALLIESWVRLDEIDDAFFNALRALRPFGCENENPVLGAASVRIESVRTVGKNHLSMRVSAGNRALDAIAFRMADRPVPDGPMDLAFTVQQDTYRTRPVLQLNIKDFRPTQAG